MQTGGTYSEHSIAGGERINGALKYLSIYCFADPVPHLFNEYII